MSWELKPLNKLGFVGRGKSKHRPRNDPALYGGEYPFIQTADVKDAQLYIDSYSATYNDLGLAQSKLWPARTLCITIAANIADTAILDFPACFPDSIIGFIADPKLADVKFVKYFYTTFQKNLQLISQGAAQDNLNMDKLLNYPIPCPPIETQKKIASILSNYDDLIQTNQQRIALLEEAAQRLYDEWFVKLRFPNHEQVPVVDGVPEGWAIKTLEQIAFIEMGQSPESKYYNSDGEGLPFHQGVSDFTHRFVENSVHTSSYTRLANAGDILCSVRAPVGRLNITLDNIAIGRGLSAFRSKENLQSLLFYQLGRIFRVEDSIGGGSIFNSVTKKELASQQILSPTSAIARQFNSIVENWDMQIKTLFQQNQKLAQARDGLLPRLMSGKMDVSGLSLKEIA